MADDKLNRLPQNCILEDRKKLSVSGVTEVLSFDEETVSTRTETGELTVKGSELHITELSLEMGEIKLEGKIDSLAYSDSQPDKPGFFSKVFR